MKTKKKKYFSYVSFFSSIGIGEDLFPDDGDLKALIGIDSSSLTIGRRLDGWSFVSTGVDVEEFDDDDDFTKALNGNDKRWVTIGKRYSFSCSTGFDSGNQLVDGNVLIESTPVEHAVVEFEEDSFEAKINAPSWVDKWREDIASINASICCASGANKHDWALCNSNNSFSFAFNLFRKNAKTFDIS